jgi:tRNA A-37 threonylcarbamoyl transferase component Bud32
MRVLEINKDFVRKKYTNPNSTLKEYQAMKYLLDNYVSFKNGDYTYRALKIFQIGADGYTMEFINGSTLSEAIFDKKNYKLIIHAAVWLANYVNQFKNNKIGYLSDYTTHNIMLSKNKEIIVIDQASAKEKTASPELIISYLIARFDFEKTLHLNFSKKYLKSIINNYNQLANNYLEIEILKECILESYIRLYKKIKNRKFNIFKRLILKVALKMSLFFVLLKINNQRHFE